MDVKIVTREPVKVAAVRHTGPYTECCNSWKTLMEWAVPKGLLGPQMEMLGICYDDPAKTSPDKIRYDACISVAEGVEGEGDVKIQEVAGGEYAVITHCGSYSELPKTYDLIYAQWIPQSDYTLREGPPFELYLNNPEETAEEDLRTEIYVPVQKQ